MGGFSSLRRKSDGSRTLAAGGEGGWPRGRAQPHKRARRGGVMLGVAGGARLVPRAQHTEGSSPDARRGSRGLQVLAFAQEALAIGERAGKHATCDRRHVHPPSIAPPAGDVVARTVRRTAGPRRGADGLYQSRPRTGAFAWATGLSAGNLTCRETETRRSEACLSIVTWINRAHGSESVTGGPSQG
jgi:hypothetical protein